MSIFIPDFDIPKVRPAPYNPRKISDEAFVELKASLAALGVTKPIILNKDYAIVAGHQRTKAMQAVGITTAPAFILDQVRLADEVRFNMFHNTVDIDLMSMEMTVPPVDKSGYFRVPADEIITERIHSHAGYLAETTRLLAAYGEWGAIIATQSGEVLTSKLYAVASKLYNLPCMCCYVPDDQRELVIGFFSKNYGEYNYDNIPKDTWVQSWVQPFRMRPGKTNQIKMSVTYKNIVLPELQKDQRYLDFGAGQMDHVQKLQSEGYNALGVEFYYRGRDNIRFVKTKEVHFFIDRLIASITTYGLFDYVLCDFVMNSVNSLQAEADVLTCLNAFTRPGGITVFSGKSREADSTNLTRKRSASKGGQHYLSFLDKDGFDCKFFRDAWIYQKLHNFGEVSSLAQKYFGSNYTIHNGQGTVMDERITTCAWAVRVVKTKVLPIENVEASLSREFNLPLPEGNSYGRDKDILAAYKKALEIEADRSAKGLTPMRPRAAAVRLTRTLD